MNRTKRFFILAIMCLLVAGSVGLQPAKAVYTMTYFDDFADWGANLATNRWACEDYFSNTDCLVYVGTPSRGDNRAAFLRIWDAISPNNWVGIGKTVAVSAPVAYNNVSCRAQLYVMSRSDNDITTEFRREGPGQIEVIDPATWTYITIRPFNFAYNNWNNWTALATNWFTPPPGKTFYLRLVAQPNRQTPGNETVNSHSRTWLFTDDMTVTCNFS